MIVTLIAIPERGRHCNRSTCQVELLCGGVVECARADADDAVSDAEQLAELLGVADHLVERLPRLVVVRGGDHELLDLLELVHAEDAPGVAAVGADLLPETKEKGIERVALGYI